MTVPVVGNHSATSAANAVTQSVSFTVTADSDRILLALPIILGGTGSGITISSVVLDPGGGNEANFTFEAANTTSISAHERTEAWYLVNPPSGTFTITVTASASSTRLFLSVFQINGVDQTDPMGANGSGGGTGFTGTVDVTTTAVDSLVAAALFHRAGDSDMTPGTDVNELMDRVQNGVTGWSGYKNAGATSTYTVDATADVSDTWNMLGVEVLAVSAAPAERVPPMVRPIMVPIPIRQLRI